MATQKCLVYQSEARLACGNCLPATVILCISSQIVANQLCSDDTDQPFTYTFIEASVVSQTKVPGSCGSSIWKYTICYDEDQIIEGQTLSASDITGIFCKGCLAQWVEDKVGNEIGVEVEAGVVTIISQHGCETSFNTGGVWWPGDSYFGDGSDGDRTVATGQQNLVDCRNKFYENLTIPVAADLNPVGEVCCSSE